jgi:hypothetical protein
MILLNENKGNSEGFKKAKKGEDTEGYKILKMPNFKDFEF